MISKDTVRSIVEEWLDGKEYFSQRRVLKGHVSIRNTLQAPKERSCGIIIPSPSLGSAKRDRLSSSTPYGMRQSPFEELYLGGGVAFTHSCAASQLAVGFMI